MSNLPLQTPAPNQPARTSQNNTANSASAYKGRSTDSSTVTADLLRRVPPHSVEAEQAVLGGIFLRNNVFHSIVDLVISEDFYIPSHSIIFAAFVELYRRSAPIDLVSVATYLQDNNNLEAAGGSVYLAELASKVVSGANAEYYATLVRDKALQRSLITVCADIIGNSFDTSRDVNSLLSESEQAVFAVADRTSSGKKFKSSKDLIAEVFEELTMRMERNESVTGVTTGYTRLDSLTAGLQPSDLVIVAARPSMGKTAFALNMAMRAAVQDNVPVAIYSLEMSMEQLMMRMLCSWGKVNLADVRRGFLEQDAWNRLYAAADVLGKAPIFIDDSPSLTPMELSARTRRLKAEAGVGMVMVDYLQLMRSAKRTDSREQEISDISRSLKALAKEMDIPVVALSQLNRKLEERGDKRPLLSDLRESGAIEQDADVIMFIYRDEVYNKNPDNPAKGTAEIIIGKQRNGPVGMATLAYVAPFTAFEDLEPVSVPSEIVKVQPAF